MELEKNIELIQIKYYLKENILKVKKTEKEKNFMMMVK